MKTTVPVIGKSKLELFRSKLGQAPWWLKKFFYSDTYFIVYAIIVFISWTTDTPEIAFAAIAILGIPSLIILDDFLPQLPIVFFSTCVFATEDIGSYLNNGFILAILALYFTTVFVHMIIYKPQLIAKKAILPWILGGFALFLGGVGYPHRIAWDTKGIAQYLSLAILPLVFYLCSAWSKENEYLARTRYFSKFLIYFGTLISFEVFYSLFFGNVLQGPMNYIRELARSGLTMRDFYYGWGISNNAANLLLLLFPAGFYLGSKKQKGWLYYTLLGFLSYFGIFATMSRGAIVIALLETPIVIFAIIKWSKTRWKQLNIALILFVIVATVALVYFEQFKNLMKEAIDEKDTGRKELYQNAIRKFLINPITGGGYITNWFGNEEVVWFYHSTLFHIIGMMGTVGLIAYGYIYINRYKIVCKGISRDPFRGFVLMSLIGFEGYAMIDTATFLPFPFMTLIMILLAEAEVKSALGDKRLSQIQYIR